MSFHVVSWVLENSEETGSARLVLIVLADHASKDGLDSYPSVETIQHEARLGARSTVQRALRGLEERGAIVPVGRGESGQVRYGVVMGPQSAAGRILHSGGPHPAAGGAASTTSGGPHPAAQTVLSERSSEPSREPTSVEQVWNHYIERIPSRRTLGSKQRAQIAAALKVRSVEELCLAIDGIAVNPHHNGQNDRAKKYLELRHAIVPHGAESIEERIDKAIGWAREFGNSHPELDPAKLSRWKEEIAYTLSLPHRPERKRAEEAVRKLRAYGFSIHRLSAAPWVRVER